MRIQDATHIEVEAEVRYWEDATVNGLADVEDADGAMIPGRSGRLWKARIRLSDGEIEGWPANTLADIHYKVCDAGTYWLANAAGRRLAKWRRDYVPDDYLCHGDRGYGDYIILKIGPTGLIKNYVLPEIDCDEWEILPPPRYVHRKRGTVYELLQEARLQLDGEHDMAEMVVYRDINSGECWTRLKAEFFDGRFEERPA